MTIYIHSVHCSYSVHVVHVVYVIIMIFIVEIPINNACPKRDYSNYVEYLLLYSN